jgi:hypothetical protein
MKMEKASKKQLWVARQYAERLDLPLGECVRYLDELFQYQRGEITAQDLMTKTGWKIRLKGKQAGTDPQMVLL